MGRVGSQDAGHRDADRLEHPVIAEQGCCGTERLGMDDQDGRLRARGDPIKPSGGGIAGNFVELDTVTESLLEKGQDRGVDQGHGLIRAHDDPLLAGIRPYGGLFELLRASSEASLPARSTASAPSRYRRGLPSSLQRPVWTCPLIFLPTAISFG